ncbi:MAG: hypothetical protein ACIAQZ_14440 [Sedimentisphaeraceae bacterium JB056]
MKTNSMQKYLFYTLCIMLLTAGLTASENNNATTLKSEELIADRHFKRGFNVLDPKHGKAVIKGQFKTDKDKEPSWNIAQWNSRYDILEGSKSTSEDGGCIYRNEAKKIMTGVDDADLILYINSVIEYDNKLRTDGQPWPHLLVEQKLQTPSLAKLKRLDFNISVKIIESETIKRAGYSKNLHTAHVPYVLIIQNANKQSAGYGDFIWFIVPLYDDRYEYPKPYIAQDKADKSAKMIFDPGGRKYYSTPTGSGKWVTINCDLLPTILEALKTAWDKGYLADSKDLDDYKIASMNMGWETTGLNKAGIAIKDLSLSAVTLR